jgi:hypothetical protein
MSILTIILFALVILMIFVFWYQSTLKSQIVSSAYLVKNMVPIALSTISNYNSSQYFYEIWVYALEAGNIFSVDGVLSLDLKNDHSMKVSVVSSGSTAKTEYNVSSAFPLQKWQCIQISVNSQLLDIYLNGKLVTSVNVNNGVATPNKTAKINFGKNKIYIAGFNFVAKTLDTDAAWKRYLIGNTFNSPIHLNFEFKKDDELKARGVLL